MRSTIAFKSVGGVPPLSSTKCTIWSAAPLGIRRPPMSTPLILVCAENGMKVALFHALHRDELRRHPVSERDSSGLVEQQGIDVAGRFNRAARHRQHVVLHQAIHPGDSD